MRIQLVLPLFFVLVYATAIIDGQTTITRVPRKPMSLKTFLAKVIGRRWNTVYFVAEILGPDGQLRRPNSNFDTFFTVVSAGPRSARINGRVALRVGPLCINDNADAALSPQLPRFRKRPRAIFDTIADDTERLFFFSDDPDSYLFQFSCESGNFTNTECFGEFAFGVLSPEGPPNRFPWIKIFKEARRQVGFDFNDPRTTFNPTGTPCPTI